MLNAACCSSPTAIRCGLHAQPARDKDRAKQDCTAANCPLVPVRLPPSAPAFMQLTERRQGNEAYRGRKYQQALHHYERARAVVEFVQVGADAW